VERELARTRRELRLLRGAVVGMGVLLGAGALGWGLTAQASRKIFINAEAFNVVDAAGRLHASLGVAEGRTWLTFFDAEGGARLQLGVGPDGPIVMSGGYQVVDEEGRVRALLGPQDAGQVLTFYDAEGRERLELGAKGDAAPAAIGLIDGSGTTRASLQLNAQDAAALTFFDGAGQVRLAAGVVGEQGRIAATGDGSVESWPR